MERFLDEYIRYSLHVGLSSLRRLLFSSLALVLLRDGDNTDIIHRGDLGRDEAYESSKMMNVEEERRSEL